MYSCLATPFFFQNLPYRPFKSQFFSPAGTFSPVSAPVAAGFAAIYLAVPTGKKDLPAVTAGSHQICLELFRRAGIDRLLQSHVLSVGKSHGLGPLCTPR